MLTVAVTGGIGAGKSTVAAMLAELGAVVIDSDDLARRVVAPGTPGLAGVVREFGTGVIAADGSLDRAALAAVVFADRGALRRLEGITHPLVRMEFRRLREAARAEHGQGVVVVNDIPILRTPAQAAEFDLVVVVVADEEVRVERLVHRGLTEADARARIAAQLSDAERRRLADVVIENNGDSAGLRERVRHLWMERLAPEGAASAAD